MVMKMNSLLSPLEHTKYIYVCLCNVSEVETKMFKDLCVTFWKRDDLQKLSTVREGMFN